MTDHEPPEVFSKYAEVLREANRVLLDEGALPDSERSALAELVADPGWWETPPRIPDGLPIPAVVWFKVRPVDAEGVRRNFVDATFYDELGNDEPGATAGRHELAGQEYIVVYQESGPQWILYGVEGLAALASLAAVLSPQIANAVNRLRRRARPDLQQADGGLPDTRFVRVEFQSREGMTGAATFAADTPLVTIEEVTSALVTALDRPRAGR